MAKVSIIVPSRHRDDSLCKHFMPMTIDDLFAKAAGEIEVILVLDGYWPNPQIQERDNLIIIHNSTAKGLRYADNAGADVATGKYIMKVDDHCVFGEGYDEILQADCDDNWVVIPRRYSLDPDKFDRRLDKAWTDYHYLSCPFTNKDGFSMHGVPWRERRIERADIEIDDEMSFQGSCWFTPRKHYFDIGGLDEEQYGTFSQEPQELGNKTWLSGGSVKVNKKTWYAHLHKGKRFGRGYFLSKQEVDLSHQASARIWMNNLWPGQTRPFEWLVDHFWPVPTWPQEWKGLEIPNEYKRGVAYQI